MRLARSVAVVVLFAATTAHASNLPLVAGQLTGHTSTTLASDIESVLHKATTQNSQVNMVDAAPGINCEPISGHGLHCYFATLPSLAQYKQIIDHFHANANQDALLDVCWYTENARTYNYRPDHAAHHVDSADIEEADVLPFLVGRMPKIGIHFKANKGVYKGQEIRFGMA